MRKLLSVLLPTLFLWLVLVCNSALSAQSRGPVTLPGTETHLLYSEKIQQHYLIDVYLPRAYVAKTSEHSFPKYRVIYVLNGRPNAVMAASMRQVGEMQREIVVGIDFADSAGNPIDSFQAYTRDLTPSKDVTWAQHVFAGEGGGAEDFLHFLNSKIKPFILKEYSVDSRDQTLVGHSFGGLFAAYTLFESQDSFDRYLILSPSLWWNDRVIFDFEKRFAEDNNDLAKRVFVSVGEREFKAGPQGMIDNAHEFHRTLLKRDYQNLDIEFKQFESEDHGSVIGPAIAEGLRSVFE